MMAMKLYASGCDLEVLHIGTIANPNLCLSGVSGMARVIGDMEFSFALSAADCRRIADIIEDAAFAMIQSAIPQE